MVNVGITGQAGFIGTHLYNTLGLYPGEFERIPFEDEFFQDEETLKNFVSRCDVIVHLAAVNRHHDPQMIYDTNIRLVKQLISSMETTGSVPHILFSSSSQEERDNLYGKSKKEGRELLANWARRNKGKFTGMIIPNVFGPFGNPYYNSVIATFSHQLTHGEEPKIEVDSRIRLIHVGELTDLIIRSVHDQSNEPEFKVLHTSESSISEILEMLQHYKSEYFEKGIIPAARNRFELNLFNTFRSYINHSKHNPVRLAPHADYRGSFTEVIRLGQGGQVSFSVTRPGITRGNHFHTRKIERFAVIKGTARIQLRRIGTNEILNFNLAGDAPSFVDMPVWYTHNITNTGDDELYTIFWTNEFYDPKDPDTFFEEVEKR
jgi:UDP-2-acetamido-2,6-beta-L-arabino-hexul-4-ose reductase